MKTLQIDRQGACLTVQMSRPDARNAMNDVMIGELADTFSSLPSDVRVVVLTGAAGVFCSGADLAWMKSCATYSEQQNREDAERLAGLFKVVNEAAPVVIGKVAGVAMGGALGLLAACDLVAATDAVRFAFSEVRLGLVPAVISPYVIAKIGMSHARRYFVTGELFGARDAAAMGLVHKVVEAEGLDKAVNEWVEGVLKCGPVAVSAAKVLVRTIEALPEAEGNRYAADTIARLRVSAEAQEGLEAFLQKRKPSWAQ